MAPSPMETEGGCSGSESASSRGSVSVGRKGRPKGKRGRGAAARDASQAKIVAVDGVGGGPEPLVEETLSSLEMPPPPAPAARAASADADVAASAAVAASTAVAASADTDASADAATAAAAGDAAKHDHAMEVVRGGPGRISAEVAKIRTEVILDTSVIVRSSTRELLLVVAKYEALISALTLRNAVLEDRHRQSKKAPPPPPPPTTQAAAPRMPSAYASAYPSLPMPSAVPVPMPRKPRETWSAIVHSSDPKISGKELADKVRKEIAPSLGVKRLIAKGLLNKYDSHIISIQVIRGSLGCFRQFMYYSGYLRGWT